MRRSIFTAILFWLSLFVQAQSNRIDSLQHLLKNKTEDTNRVNNLNQLASAYLYSKNDTSLVLAKEGLALAKKINFKNGEIISLIIIGNNFNNLGNYPRSLELFLEALRIGEEIKNKALIARVISSLADTYFYTGDFSRSIHYSKRSIDINRELGRLDAMNNGMLNLGDTYEKINRLDSALLLTKAAYGYAAKNSSVESTMGIALANLGNIYKKMKQPDSAMYFYRLGNKELKEKGNDYTLNESYLGMADLFLKKGQTDSSLYYAKQSFHIAKSGGLTEGLMKASTFLADYYRSINNTDSAYAYLLFTTAAKDSLYNHQKANEFQGLSFEETMRQQQMEGEKERSRRQLRLNALMGSMATLLIVVFLLFLNNRQKIKANKLLQKQKDEIDSKAEELAVQKDNVELLSEIGRKITSSLSVEKIISTAYDNVNKLMDASVFGIGIYNDDLKRIDFPATYENGKALPAYAQSVDDKNRFGSLCFTSEKEIIIGDLDKQYKDHLQQVLTPHAGEQPMSIIFLPLTAKEKKLGVITVQSFEKNAYSDYHLYMLRNIAIYTAIALENADSYDELNHTVANLKSAQQLLIQSEKMASLGELTAGIAHEIQNPLNFVNNFSEVNNELIAELKSEKSKPKSEQSEEMVSELLNNLALNLEKINHHGKRADGIVKGMLQHSRASSGKKEPTDINALTDEYLRLAYHGLRAKNKSFNANMKTCFDSSIGTANVIPQDIGRVILNLITNAFYSVNEKKKLGIAGFDPTVTVSTKKADGKILISVKDNGNGIPDKVIDKIFQPFFTTKPTGQGTGLGLSMSYDIVKAHGGEVKVQTKQGEGTEFIIQLLPD